MHSRRTVAQSLTPQFVEKFLVPNRFNQMITPHLFSVLTCTVLNQVLNDFKVPVEASGSQWGRVGLRRRVDVRATVRQQFDDL